MGQKQILCNPITRQPNPTTRGLFIGYTLVTLRVTHLATRTRCMWGRTHCTVWCAHLERWPHHLLCMISGGCCCYGTRIRDSIGYPSDTHRIPDSNPEAGSFSLFFLGFGDSTPINRNSKLYAGNRRTYDRRQGEIQARKRYGQANVRKGNLTFRV
jgi:hypothetical protein